MPSVFLAVPSRGELAGGTAFALTQCGSKHNVSIHLNYSSLLTLNFNQLWCQALNQQYRPDYFAMLHDDVVPLEPGWLDSMIAALEASEADVVSAILPIKDVRGLTSTALYNPCTGMMQRLTMTEACQMPLTFTGSVKGPEWYVLPNTGLWFCKFGRWAEKICFQQRDRIVKDHDGKYTAQCFSEDWDFGVQCCNLGVQVAATRSVRAVHKGRHDYPNFVPWGALTTDPDSVKWDPPHRVYRSF